MREPPLRHLVGADGADLLAVEDDPAAVVADLELVDSLLPDVQVVDQLTCAEETLAGPPRPPEDLR